MIKPIMVSLMASNAVLTSSISMPHLGSSHRQKFFEMKASPNTQKSNYAANKKYLPYYDFHVFEVVYNSWIICFFGVEKLPYAVNESVQRNTRFACLPQPPQRVSFPPVGGSIGIGNLDLTESFDTAEDLQDYPTRITMEYLK
jgi:hypothetical protein